MGPRFTSRGNFRGRGRGGRGSRGRGRGRGGGAGRYHKFSGSRLADAEEVESEESEEESEEEPLLEEEDEESGSDKGAKAYAALMKSFETESAKQPPAKRRRVEHSEDSEEDAMVEDEDGDSEQNENEDDDDDDEDEDDEDATEKDIDHVDDRQSDSEEEIVVNDNGDDDDDDDDHLNAEDPFESHFAHPDMSKVVQRLDAIADDAWTPTKSVVDGSRELFSTPQVSGDSSSSFVPPSPVTDLHELQLLPRLQEKLPTPNAIQQKLAPLLFNYYDVLCCERTPENAASLRQVASLHILNHVLKNNQKLKAKADEEEAEKDKKKKKDDPPAKENITSRLGQTMLLSDDEDDDEDSSQYRDQGFTRPKVLILLPTRNACARMVDSLSEVCRFAQQDNRARFEEAYVEKEPKFADSDRPADYCDLFEGNDDDMFRLGIKFLRSSMRLFTPFYDSDVIVASPLGLRMAMGSEEGSSSDKKKKDEDYDFLSSIEMVMLDQADGLLMQNWEHVEHIFAKLNLHPHDDRGEDLNRIRSWYVDGQARHFRQTVVFSAFHTPTLAELLRRHCHNWQGKVRVQPATYRGVVGDLSVRRNKQTFSRFASAESIELEPDARFDYFIKAVVPSLITKHGHRRHHLVVSSCSSPSYLDFVRVRNWFSTAAAASNVSFGTVSEYASVPDASRALSHFFSGRHRVLLYTERAHHFHRHRVNGACTVVFYGLPENPVFYTEIAGHALARSVRSGKMESGQGVVRAMYAPLDALKLERIVGTQRVGRMLRDTSDIFVFEAEQAY